MLLTALGLLGMSLFILAYFQLQRGEWDAHGFSYPFANLSGALLVLLSFLEDWNLPAFLLEVTWALISIWGLFHYFRRKRKI